MDNATFLQLHPVFTLDAVERELAPERGRRAALKRVQYLKRTGRLRPIVHRVYAAIPAGADPSRFQPDRYLVAAAVRPDAIFTYHAALELLGAAHSDWNVCTVITGRRRPAVALDGVTIRFVAPPVSLTRRGALTIGVRVVDRGGHPLRTTGPERTRVDGFRKPEPAGGPPELVESAAGFGVLDLPLLERILQAYDEKSLWAAAGWFLERFQRTFFVPPEYLRELERHRPKAPQYLLRSERRGVLAKRWNLLVPEYVEQGSEPDEPES